MVIMDIIDNNKITSNALNNADPEIVLYRRLNTNGDLLEQWEKINDIWINCTALALVRKEFEDAKKELRKLLRK